MCSAVSTGDFWHDMLFHSDFANAVEKRLTYVVHLTAGINSYKLRLGEDSVGVNRSVMYDDDEVTCCVSVSRTGGCHSASQHAKWTYNVSVDKRGQRGVNMVHRQLTVSIARH